MAPTPNSTAERHFAADVALETLRVLREHAKQCRQCKLDQFLCDTYRAYYANFEKDFLKWERQRDA